MIRDPCLQIKSTKKGLGNFGAFCFSLLASMTSPVKLFLSSPLAPTFTGAPKFYVPRILFLRSTQSQS